MVYCLWRIGSQHGANGSNRGAGELEGTIDLQLIVSGADDALIQVLHVLGHTLDYGSTGLSDGIVSLLRGHGAAGGLQHPHRCIVRCVPPRVP